MQKKIIKLSFLLLFFSISSSCVFEVPSVYDVCQLPESYGKVNWLHSHWGFQVCCNPIIDEHPSNQAVTCDLGDANCTVYSCQEDKNTRELCPQELYEHFSHYRDVLDLSEEDLLRITRNSGIGLDQNEADRLSNLPLVISRNEVETAASYSGIGVCSHYTPSKICVDERLIDPEVDQTLVEGYEENETRCDGLDNDCDGQTDEGLDCSCEGEAPLGDRQNGVCQGARKICNPETNQYSIEPDYDAYNEAFEIDENTCDGIDNDCDGQVDENNICQCQGEAPLASNQDGVCNGSLKICNYETLSYEEPDYFNQIKVYEENEQTCDGLDNDCDGQIDENLVCDCQGEAPLADRQAGVCQGARKTCNTNTREYSDEPDYANYSGFYENDEVSCDGLDNDCNGIVDDVADVDNDQLFDCPDIDPCLNNAINDPDGDGICNLSFANLNQAININTGQGSQQMTVVDFNRDGNLDIAVSNRIDDPEAHQITILRYDGNPNNYFSAENRTFPTGSRPVGITSADLNNDNQNRGTPDDIIVTNSRDDSISVFLNLGNDYNRQDYPVGDAPRRVSVGLFNNDLFPDILATNFGDGDNTLSVLTNNGDGSFNGNGQQQLINVGDRPTDAIAFNLDNQNRDDIAAINFNSNDLYVLRNNENNLFNALPNPFDLGNEPVDILSSDLDGNGTQDLIIANDASNDISIYLNQNGLLVAHPNNNIDVCFRPQAVTAEDFNGDNIVDIAIACRGNGEDIPAEILFLLGQEIILIEENQEIISYSYFEHLRIELNRSAESILSLDLNQDGRADILTLDTVNNNLIIFIQE